MALVVKDRVRETSVTQGTGTFTLAGAVTGYQSFSAIGNGNTTYYTIYLQASNEWEVGIGTYTASGTTLSRDTILASSNGGSVVNFSAGTKDVFVTYPAGRSVYYDTATNVTVNQLSATTVDATNVEVTNIKAKDGTAALSIADSTGVVSVSTSLNVGSAGQFTVSSGGKVNINASQDTAILRQTSASSYAGLRIYNDQNSGSRALEIDYSGSAYSGAFLLNGPSGEQAAIATTGAYPLTLGTANTARAVITSGGQVNIGGNFTSTNNTLQVTGNAAIGYTTAAPTTGLIVAGNVGVGTASPQVKLHASEDSSGGAYLRLENARTSTFDGDFFGQVQFSGNDNTPGANGIRSSIAALCRGVSGQTDLVFSTAPAAGAVAERMRLDSSGNLGIGTNSPTSKFAVSNGTNRLEVAPGASNVVLQALNEARTATTELLSAGSILTYWTGAAGSQAEKMRLDSSGNLGLGVTPSAWSASLKSFDINGGSLMAGSASAVLASNGYFNGSNWVYKSTGYATRYENNYGALGQHAFFTAASGTAGNAITFTQAMTLDASGNLGVGETNPAAGLHLKKQEFRQQFDSAYYSFYNTAGVRYAYIQNNANTTIDYASENGAIPRWLVGGTERARITSDGNLLIATTINPGDRLYTPGSIRAGTVKVDGGAYITGPGSDVLAMYAGSAERARITSGGDLLVQATSSSVTSDVGHKIRPDAAAPFMGTVGSSTSGADVTYSLYSTGAAAYRFYVGYNGTISATTTTITGISDVRLKENIRDLDDGLETVMALKPRKFDWKEGKGADTKNARGFIAQEFETVLPDLIDEWKDPAPEGEEPYKAVRADLIPVLVKAIQEQQAMINELKAEVAALKGV